MEQDPANTTSQTAGPRTSKLQALSRLASVPLSFIGQDSEHEGFPKLDVVS